MKRQDLGRVRKATSSLGPHTGRRGVQGLPRLPQHGFVGSLLDKGVPEADHVPCAGLPHR